MNAQAFAHFTLDEFLETDRVLFLQLLQILAILLQHKARGQRVTIDAFAAVGTLPEPAVFAVLHRFDEEFAHLQDADESSWRRMESPVDALTMSV